MINVNSSEATNVTGRGAILLLSLSENQLTHEQVVAKTNVKTQHGCFRVRSVEASRDGNGNVSDKVVLVVTPIIEVFEPSQIHPSLSLVELQRMYSDINTTYTFHQDNKCYLPRIKLSELKKEDDSRGWLEGDILTGDIHFTGTHNSYLIIKD